MSKITVSKNGETREFTTEMWNALPLNKYGWVAAAEVPEEVKALQEQLPAVPGVIEPAAAEVPEEVKAETETVVAKEKTKTDGKAQK